jgi:hypothetical protein
MKIIDHQDVAGRRRALGDGSLGTLGGARDLEAMWTP